MITSFAPTYDPEPATVTEDEEMSKEKEIDKLMALIYLSFKKIYKPTNNNLRTSSNTSRANQDNSPRINKGTGYDNQRAVNVAGARENVGTPVVQKSGIQCYNYKEYGHVSRECQKPKRNKLIGKDEHHVQPESSNDIYLTEQGDTNITIDSLDICYDRVHYDQDDTDDLDQEHDLLASLIQKLKCCYNDNLALMLAPESDETIRLDKESRSKLSDLIRPFDYDKLNNLYDLFVPQREKSPEQHYFPRTSKMSHTSSNNEFSKESFP
ncbi:retrovirus-related pol polyprotein from transposon TNT 1-94 [Tanacetum coccineum]